MIARVVEGEIDAVRMSLDEAVEAVRGSVIPALREQEGYGGMYLLLTDHGRALAISLWTTEEAAESGTVGTRPLYQDQIETFTAIYRASPGRETYRVALADTPEAPNDDHGQIADRLRQVRSAADEAHREHQKKIDWAIDELDRKANELYAQL
jgi:heme-degrading monooxygenase HmoA